MRKRAEDVDSTRRRITEAAVRLHTTVGPANTTISGVADEAGVTRVTVYRHFESEEELFVACSGMWLGEHLPPDPTPWTRVEELEDRARRAFSDLYGWYAANGEDLFPIYRDIDAMPRTRREQIRGARVAWADAIVAGLGLRGRRQRRVRALAGHLVSFWTWRSLVVDQGLNNAEAIDLAASLLVCAADG